jgi:hypothetical protein
LVLGSCSVAAAAITAMHSFAADVHAPPRTPSATPEDRLSQLQIVMSPQVDIFAHSGTAFSNHHVHLWQEQKILAID